MNNIDGFIFFGGGSQLAECFARLYPALSQLIPKNYGDVTSVTRLERILENHELQYVVNCAAITDVERCEDDPYECFRINAYGAGILNRLCIKYHKKLIHISSDYGVCPVNQYGWSKYISERLIDGKNLVVRTNFFSDKTYSVKKLLSGEKFGAYNNVYFNPVSINRLAKTIYECRNKTGVVNVFSNQSTSFYDFACLLCKILGKNSDDFITNESYQCPPHSIKRLLNLYIRPDINIGLKRDISEFFRYHRTYGNFKKNQTISSRSTS